MGKIHVLTSGKGGVGKTTSAINLAAALNLHGENVLIVDGNLSTPNIGLHLGAPIVPITLNHVLNNDADIGDAIYQHESGFKILPSSLSIKDLQNIKHNNLSNISRQLKKLADYIILDSSAGLGREAESAINAGDEIIIVTQSEMPSVTDALKTVKLAENLNKKINGFIITRHKKRKTEMPLSNICDMLEIPHLGTIPEDKNIQKALVLKDAILHTHPRSKSSKAYKELAKKLLGKQYLKNQEKEKKSFFKKIFEK